MKLYGDIYWSSMMMFVEIVRWRMLKQYVGMMTLFNEVYGYIYWSSMMTLFNEVVQCDIMYWSLMMLLDGCLVELYTAVYDDDVWMFGEVA